MITTYHPELTPVEVSLLRRVNVDMDVEHETELKEAEKELEGEKWWV